MSRATSLSAGRVGKGAGEWAELSQWRGASDWRRCIRACGYSVFLGVS